MEEETGRLRVWGEIQGTRTEYKTETERERTIQREPDRID